MSGTDVIIPTLNAQDKIGPLLDTLARQSVSAKVYVIDSASSDETAATAQSHGGRVLVIDRKDFDHGGTRNLASRQTSGEFLLFLTQDALPASDDYIEKLIHPLQNPKIGASFGRQLPRPDATPPEKFARLFNYPDAPIVKGKEDLPRLGIKTFFFTNVCSAIKRAVFNELGGFPERIIMNEDMIFAAKAILRGYKIAYIANACVYHSHNYSLVEQFKRYFDIGVSLYEYKWILDYGNAEGKGAEFLREQLRYLKKKRSYQWMPVALGDAFVRYLGFRLGLHNPLLPRSVLSRLSMHSYYWK
jgi:rhamnosyltransferase